MKQKLRKNQIEIKTQFNSLGVRRFFSLKISLYITSREKIQHKSTMFGKFFIVWYTSLTYMKIQIL